jgi:glycosyltransferase involved in cell wall biosynthesis
MEAMKQPTESVTISLITATCGRSNELIRLLHSLATQSISRNDFELIIVDQNDVIDLCPIIDKYSSQINITHIRSSVLGLSYNRNIGLENARGHIYGFPDDDCIYYHDTLATVLSLFTSYPSVSVLLGKIYDRSTNDDIARSWPSLPKRLTKWNYFLLHSSNTLFVRACNQRFDERFGVGSIYGACEDTDFVLNSVKSASVMFDPTIHVLHFDKSTIDKSTRNNFLYGVGFGAFIAKNFSLQSCFLFAGVVTFHALQGIKSVLSLDLRSAKARSIAFTSRFVGLAMYARNECKRYVNNSYTMRSSE